MKKLVLCLLFVASIQLHAGISSIGNGGGLGELQFIYYFNNTNQIIEICERSPSCKLSTEQKSSWNQLKQQQPNRANNVNISFEPDLTHIWEWSNDTLSISQQWLYQNKLDFLRPDADIMILALSVQLAHSHALDFNSIYEQTAKSLSGLGFYKQSTVAPNGVFLFHWVTFSNNADSTDNLKLFVLEDQTNSYTLNDLFLQKYKYLNLNSLDVYNVSVTNSETQVTVYGSISGRNNGNYFNQRPFKFAATINREGLIEKDSVQLFLFLE